MSLATNSQQLVHGVNGSLDTFIEQQPTSVGKLQYTCPATRLLTKDKEQSMKDLETFEEAEAQASIDAFYRMPWLFRKVFSKLFGLPVIVKEK